MSKKRMKPKRILGPDGFCKRWRDGEFTAGDGRTLRSTGYVERGPHARGTRFVRKLHGPSKKLKNRYA